MPKQHSEMRASITSQGQRRSKDGAEECRVFAAEAHAEHSRAVFLKMAEAFDALAKGDGHPVIALIEKR